VNGSTGRRGVGVQVRSGGGGGAGSPGGLRTAPQGPGLGPYTGNHSDRTWFALRRSLDTVRVSPSTATQLGPVTARSIEQDQKQVVRSGARAQRFEIRRQYRRVTKNKRVAGCGHPGLRDDSSAVLRVTEGVTDSPHGRAAGFAGLFHCGNPWVCMTCAAVIAAERAAELTRVLAHYVERGGWACMITMTLKHNRRHTLDQALAALTYGYSCAISGAAWDQGKPAGYAGWCKVIEITDGPNGWHPHTHVVVVFETRPSRDAIEAMANGMFDRFSRAVQRKGMPAPERDNHGLDIRHLDDGQTEGQSPEQLAEVWARYVAKGLAAEATLGASKKAKGENRSIRELMEDALLPRSYEAPGSHTVLETLDLTAQERLVEYERATKGKRVMTWSKGKYDLRRDAGLDEERSDEEIAEDSELEGTDVAVITRDGWAKLERMRGQAELLDVTERLGAEAGQKWLTRNGIEWYRPTGLTDQRRHDTTPGTG
jgi:hypothetical protein